MLAFHLQLWIEHDFQWRRYRCHQKLIGCKWSTLRNCRQFGPTLSGRVLNQEVSVRLDYQISKIKDAFETKKKYFITCRGADLAVEIACLWNSMMRLCTRSLILWLGSSISAIWSLRVFWVDSGNSSFLLAFKYSLISWITWRATFGKILKEHIQGSKY